MRRLLIILTSVALFQSCSGLKRKDELGDKQKELNEIPKQERFEIKEFLITPKSVGFAILGQTIGDFRKAYEGYELQSIPVWNYCVDGGGDGILVSKDNELLLFVWTMQGNDSIHSIVGLSETLKTKEGLGPMVSIGQLMKIYPELTVSIDGLCEETEFFYERKNKIRYEFISGDSIRIGRYTDNDVSVPFDTVRQVDKIVISNR